MREAVRTFAEAMERKLQKNDPKGGWSEDTPMHLYERLLDEELELDNALVGEAVPAAVLDELVDVANFCMMLYTKYAGYTSKKEHQE